VQRPGSEATTLTNNYWSGGEPLTVPFNPLIPLFSVFSLSFVPFAGEKLVNFLAEPKKGTKWPSNLPRFDSRTQAVAVCKDLVKLQFLIRSEKQGKGELGVRALSSVQDEKIVEDKFLLLYLYLSVYSFFFLNRRNQRTQQQNRYRANAISTRVGILRGCTKATRR